LLALNHQRYALEVAQGLHDKKPSKSKKAHNQKNSEVQIGLSQGVLLSEPDPTQGELL